MQTDRTGIIKGLAILAVVLMQIIFLLKCASLAGVWGAGENKDIEAIAYLGSDVFIVLFACFTAQYYRQKRKKLDREDIILYIVAVVAAVGLSLILHKTVGDGRFVGAEVLSLLVLYLLCRKKLDFSE